MAPISPAYVWEETETSVIVTATCRGATSANTDAFSSPHYVSVNSPPFFLELDLHGRIDSIAASTAVRRGGQIELRLPKAQPGLWGRLLVELPKPERLRRRAESRAAAEALALEQVERKKKKQWDDSRFALNHQMTKDREDRDRIAELKKAEKAAAAAEANGDDADDDAEGGGSVAVGAGGAGGRYEPRHRMQRPPTGAPPEPSRMRFKVVDLGNSCWRDRHFTSDIQTRQYRCPEVIIGSGYDISADVWSVACVLFEAATGDLLFSPKAGQSWSRDEDHLALIMELVGKMPRKLALGGKYSKEFFSQKGELRNIKDLRFWELPSVLQSKYEFSPEVADPFAAFLTPMLDLDPHRRCSARHLLHHPWLVNDDMHASTLAQLGEKPPSDLPDWSGAAQEAAPAVEKNGVSKPDTPVYSPNYAEGKGNGVGGTDAASAPAAAPAQQQLSSSVIPIQPPDASTDPETLGSMFPDATIEPMLGSGPGKQPSHVRLDAHGRTYHASTGLAGPRAIVAYYAY